MTQQYYSNGTVNTHSHAKENSSVSASKAAPSKRLVDYTQCRRDGTMSSKANNFEATTQHTKRTWVMGMPACHALEASLLTTMLVDDEEKAADRIDFYLKVPPKSQRNISRVSTLDRAHNRRDAMQQGALSNRSLFARSATTSATPMSSSYRSREHTRSSSAPIPPLIIYTTNRRSSQS